MSELLIDGAEIEAGDAGRVGGKAEKLAALARAGIPVPPFVVVAVAAGRLISKVPEVTKRLAELELAGAGAPEVARALAEELERGPLPLDVGAAVREAWRRVSGGGRRAVAVRSSASFEDGRALSFAGQLRSELQVASEEACVEAARRCYAAALRPGLLAYRRTHGVRAPHLDLALVVQAMVAGEVSGVLFTRDPQSGQRQTVVAASFGLCAGVVDGSVECDSYRVHDDGIIEATVEHKASRIAPAAGGGVLAVPVAAGAQGGRCLDDDALRRLRALGERAEELLGAPADVEWTLASGTLYALQARPITQAAEPVAAAKADAPAPGAVDFLFDNSNIVESYPGVTAPLTFSYIRFAYGVAYRQACAMSGVPKEEIDANARTFDSMLATVDGRVYYNLGSWYRVLALFPGFEKNRVHMERMMGVRESARILAEAPARGVKQRLAMLYCMLRNYRRAPALVRRFERDFRAAYDDARSIDPETLALPELLDAYHRFTQKFLWRWQAPLVTDFLAMFFHGTLRDLVARWGLDDGGALHNDLLCGQGGIESTEPTKALLRLAARARAEPPLRALLEATADDECLALLERDARFAAFAADIRQWLERWGARAMSELKLEEPTLEEEPAFLFAMLKNYLRRVDLDDEGLARKESERRTRAERTAAEKLKGPLKKLVFGWVLGEARKHVKNRENMRFARTRSFALLRTLFLRIGREYQARGLLDDASDVFFLELNEALGAIDGTATSVELKALAAVRKAEHARYRSLPEPDERLRVSGAAALAPRLAASPSTTTGSELRGVPCSPGSARARARVIRSAADDLRLGGEILVAARTDPGWVPLYPSARGLLVERGSLLSHSAIVAREMGLPTIVNIPGLLARICDGDNVEMDADRGVVRLDP